MLLLLLIFPLCSAYMNNWFPIVSKSSTDFTNPKQIRILGNDFVLWKKDDAIILQDDVCPHRCAPLSEGYIDRKTNNLRCAYHGWEFNENGTNTFVPQSSNKITSKKSCVKNYEIVEYGDIIWGYFGDLPKDHPENIYNLTDSDTFVRELPYSFYILLENFFDPAHIPFAHHKLQSVRSDGSPIDVKLLKSDNNKFSIEFEDHPENEKKKRVGEMNIELPCHYFLQSIKTKSNILNSLHVFVVPIQEDKTRIFIHYDFNKNTTFYKIFNLLPIWIQHINTNLFLDSDTLILHKQEQYLNSDNKTYHEHNNYFMPTTSDKSIVLYKKWIKKNLPTIPYFRKIKELRQLSRREILDRYEQHTKNCIHCKTVLKNIIKIQKYGTLLLGMCFIHFKSLLFALAAYGNYKIFGYFKKMFYFQDYIHNEID